jgi:hypothetical protein
LSGERIGRDLRNRAGTFCEYAGTGRQAKNLKYTSKIHDLLTCCKLQNFYTVFEIMDDEALANRVGGKIKAASFTNKVQSLPAPQTGETKLPVSWLCPHCGSAMVLIEKFTAQEIRWKLAKREPLR